MSTSSHSFYLCLTALTAPPGCWSWVQDFCLVTMRRTWGLQSVSTPRLFVSAPIRSLTSMWMFSAFNSSDIMRTDMPSTSSRRPSGLLRELESSHRIQVNDLCKTDTMSTMVQDVILPQPEQHLHQIRAAQQRISLKGSLQPREDCRWHCRWYTGLHSPEADDPMQGYRTWLCGTMSLKYLQVLCHNASPQEEKQRTQCDPSYTHKLPWSIWKSCP